MYLSVSHFFATGFFLYPPKISENFVFFGGGVKKGTSGMKRINTKMKIELNSFMMEAVII